jgi:hypothetical protein
MSTTSKRATSKILQTGASNPKIPVRAHAVFAKVQTRRNALSEFIATNKKVLQDYRELLDNLNEAVDEAKKIYLDNRDALGKAYQGFKLKPKRSLDVPKLLELCPEAKERVRTEPKMTLPEFEAAVAEGLIPEEIQEDVITVTYSVEAPSGL